MQLRRYRAGLSRTCFGDGYLSCCSHKRTARPPGRAVGTAGAAGGVAGLALALYAGLRTAPIIWVRMLRYFCALYLGLEVLRRAVYSTQCFCCCFSRFRHPSACRRTRWPRACTSRWGMALGGGLLFALHTLPGGQTWAPFIWMGSWLCWCVLLVIDSHLPPIYVAELQHALGQRFTPKRSDLSASTSDISAECPYPPGARQPRRYSAAHAEALAQQGAAGRQLAQPAASPRRHAALPYLGRSAERRPRPHAGAARGAGVRPVAHAR